MFGDPDVVQLVPVVLWLLQEGIHDGIQQPAEVAEGFPVAPLNRPDHGIEAALRVEGVLPLWNLRPWVDWVFIG